MKKLKIESYEHTTKERSWGSCQENDSSDSAYYNVTKILYRIIYNNQILEDNIYSEDLAMYIIKNNYIRNRVISNLKKDLKEINNNIIKLKTKLKETKNSYNKQLQKLKSMGL